MRALYCAGQRRRGESLCHAGSWGETVPDLYLRTLQRAAKIVGGEEALALHLKVTPSHLSLWLKGLERPTTEAFLRAVDLVSEYELAQLPQAPSITPSAPPAAAAD